MRSCVRSRNIEMTATGRVQSIPSRRCMAAPPRLRPFGRRSSMGAFGHQLSLVDADWLTGSDGKQPCAAAGGM